MNILDEIERGADKIMYETGRRPEAVVISREQYRELRDLCSSLYTQITSDLNSKGNVLFIFGMEVIVRDAD